MLNAINACKFLMHWAGCGWVVLLHSSDSEYQERRRRRWHPDIIMHCLLREHWLLQVVDLHGWWWWWWWWWLGIENYWICISDYGGDRTGEWITVTGVPHCNHQSGGVGCSSCCQMGLQQNGGWSCLRHWLTLIDQKLQFTSTVAHMELSLLSYTICHFRHL